MMKVVWKIILIVAVILLILGIALIAVSLFTGGSLKSIQNNVMLTNFDQSFPGETPESISVNLNAGKLVIQPGETLRVEAKNVMEDGFVCTLENGELTVREDPAASWSDNLARLLSLRDNEMEIVIYLPDGTELDDADVRISAGNAEITEMHAQKLTLHMSAGTLKTKDLHVDDAELSMSAGDMNFTGFVAQTLKLDVSAGTAYVNGLVKNSCKVHLSAGTASLGLLGSTEDYTAKIESAAGEIVYDGHSYSLENARVGQGAGTMDLSNSAGTITVKFFEPVA